MNIHTTPKGIAILKAMMIDRFVEISDSAYDSIRKMEQAVLSARPSTTQKTDRQTIYFGVIPRDNPRIMYERYQPLLDYLSEKTFHKYELALKKNYAETVNAIGSGEINIAILGPLTYLEAHAKYGAICILKPKGADGHATYKMRYNHQERLRN